MTRHREPFDLRMANDHAAQRRRSRMKHRRRTKPARDRVQVRWFLGPLVRTGAVQR